MKRIVQILILMSLAAFMLVGCSSNNNDSNSTDNNEKLGIRGIVMDITVNGENASILVEGNIEEDTMYDKAMVKITKDTMIQKDSMSKLFAISDIEKGAKVEVIFEGPVQESYPVQGTASIVRIITE